MQCLSVLTIGGSDSAGGAGIQADLKTFQDFGVHGASVVTCVTAQNSFGVTHVEAMSSASVTQQIDAVLSDLRIPALKTGMLFSAELVELVAHSLQSFTGSIIVDPVMVSRAGSKLLGDDAIALYQKFLFSRATLLTPNVQEAVLLSGREIVDQTGVEHAAQWFLEAGAKAVLIKGGGLVGLAGHDYFCTRAGVSAWYRRPAIDTPHTHGTGCTLSAAIAAALVRGLALQDAVIEAKTYINQALRHPVLFGQGAGCVGRNLHRLDPAG